MGRLLGGRIFPVGLALVVAGCATHIHEVDKVAGAQVISLDAKQRAVLTNERPVSKIVQDRNGTVEKTFVTTYRAFCAEPSPDVFSVLSQALSASGSLGKDTSSVNAALQAAFGSTETGSTIPRTQTINMLRELMYRTCERYISGALDELQFPIQAVRDQHLMVSILAIEQLTGAVTPPTVTLTGTASSGAGQSSSEAVVRLDDAWKALQKADAATLASKSDYQKLESEQPKCSELKAKVDSGSPPAAGSDEGKKWQECTAQEAKVNDAEKTRKDAASHYDALKAAAAGGGASASSGGKASVDAGQQANAQSVAEVTQAVTEIVNQNFKQDEFELFCIRVMNQKADPAVVATCTDYVEKAVGNRAAKLENDSARLKLNTKLLMEQTQKIKTGNQANFDKFWPKVASAANSQTADPQKLRALIDKYIDDHFPGNSTSVAKKQLTKLREMSRKAEIKKQFGFLAPEVQEALSN